MRLDYYASLKYVRIMADSANLNVVFEKGKCQPRTDGHTIYVQQPEAQWTNDEWSVWFYTVLHEIGHERVGWNNWKELMKADKIYPGSFVGYVRNQFSDYGQERDQFGMYRGRDTYMSRGRFLWVNPSIDKPEESKDDHRDASIAIWIWDTMLREAWMPDLVGLAKRGVARLQGKQVEYFDKLLQSGLHPDEILCESDVMPFTRKVIAALGFDADDEEKQSQESFEASGEGNPPSATVSYDDLLAHKHDDDAEWDSMTDLHIEYSKINYGKSYTPSKAQILNFEDDKFPNETYRISTANVNSLRQAQLAGIQVGKGLSGKIKRLLQIRGQARYQHGMKVGKLSTKSLYKGTKLLNSDRVFKVKSQHMILDTAVTVLTDFSGSMSNRKIIHAMRSVTLLNDAIGKLKVPLEILGFTEDYNGAVNSIFKSFNKPISNEQLESRMLRGANVMDSNADGESIQWAFERLLTRKESRKILIVLSDGSPSGYNSGDITWYTKRVIENIETNSPVEIYGIGIMDTNVKLFYKDWQVISSSEQLEDAVLTVIKNKILN